jgi:hypothetical protein
MGSVSFSGEDHEAVAGAAQEADKRGDADQANILDKLARKMLAKMELQQNGRGLRYKGDVPNAQYPWQTICQRH